MIAERPCALTFAIVLLLSKLVWLMISFGVDLPTPESTLGS